MINSFLTEEGLTPIGAIYVARCEEVRNLAVQYTDEIKLSEIYVFGSLARARPQTNYDVDLMFAIDGDIADVEHARDVIMCDLSEDYEEKYRA